MRQRGPRGPGMIAFFPFKMFGVRIFFMNPKIGGGFG